MRYIAATAAVLIAWTCAVAAPPVKSQPDVIIIEAYVDGPSQLHFAKDGIYWVNGQNAKPGKLDANNYPTYINGEAWTPTWRKPGDDRGVDTSDKLVITLPLLDYRMEVMAIDIKRGTFKIEKGREIGIEHVNDELVISIPHSNGYIKWYKLRLKRR